MIRLFQYKNKYGYISLIIGVFNLVISTMIFYALYCHIHYINLDYILIYIAILKVCGTIEIYTKILGLMLGVVSYFKKEKRKITYYALGINIIVSLWTVLLFMGVIL